MDLAEYSKRKKQKRCIWCACPDKEKPMIFRGGDWCSEECRKWLVKSNLV